MASMAMLNNQRVETMEKTWENDGQWWIAWGKIIGETMEKMNERDGKLWGKPSAKPKFFSRNLEFMDEKRDKKLRDSNIITFN